MEKDQLNKIKEIAEEFFSKMTCPAQKIDAKALTADGGEAKDIIEIEVTMQEPQILIGQGGQTLLEIQRLLKIILNKKLSRLEIEDLRQGSRVIGPRQQSGQSIFYFNLDINDYKKKKVEYLKSLAKDLANDVALSKKEKSLSPMSAYERRIVHAELSQRIDVSTESQGEGLNRHIIIKIKPK